MDLLSRAELWQKNDRIYEFTWKFALPQLSRGKTCPKIKLSYWCDFKIWSALWSRVDILQKNQEVLIVPFGNLNYPYYHKVKVHENRTISIQSLKDSSFPYITSWTFRKNSFVEVFWNLKLSLLSRTEIFWTIEQFWSGALKIWTDSIITSWNFLKIKRFCWSDLKIWTSPFMKRWNFLKSKAVSVKWFENLNWPFYHELKFSQK